MDSANNPKSARPTAVLVAVQLPDVSDDEFAGSLAELTRLVDTLGYTVVGQVTQRRSHLAADAVLGEGKRRELAHFTGGDGLIGTAAKPKISKARARFEFEHHEKPVGIEHEDAEPFDDGDELPDDGNMPTHGKNAEFVIVDHEISPSQARNLEKATSATVMDRTGVIVEIFHRHARSREARLQVEIARLAYVAPRMRESGGGAERQAGKGAGESSLELDRRKIRDRIAELRQELVHIAAEQDNRRSHRHGQRRVALVGYTNAGKSSWFRALTGSDVLVADKLFATLDTTIRALHPEAKPRILVSDTVGFIKKLPHDLVASFRSTLDEAHEASLLLYIVDAADPTYEAQLEVTREVLREIGAEVVPSKLILNKVDCVDPAHRAILRARHPEAIQLSAKRPEDVLTLRAAIIEFFEESMEDLELRIPYSNQSLRGAVFESAHVLGERWDDLGNIVHVKTDAANIARLLGLGVERVDVDVPVESISPEVSCVNVASDAQATGET